METELLTTQQDRAVTTMPTAGLVRSTAYRGNYVDFALCGVPEKYPESQPMAGQSLSELILKGVRPRPASRMRDGIPYIDLPPDSPRITYALLQHAHDVGQREDHLDARILFGGDPAEVLHGSLLFDLVSFFQATLFFFSWQKNSPSAYYGRRLRALLSTNYRASSQLTCRGESARTGGSGRASGAIVS